MSHYRTKDGKLLKWENKNISRLDEFLSHISYYVNKETVMKQIVMYRRTYYNYVNIILGTLKKRYPLTAILRNGSKVILQDNLEAYLLAQAGTHLDNYDDKIVTLSSLPYLKDRKLKVKLYGLTIDSDSLSIFVENSYQYLPVNGRLVVDIGANNGDSSIYFALREADKVIGIEPFSQNYDMANKNIQLNGLSNKIVMLQAGCSARTGSTTVNPNQVTSVSTLLESGSGDGIQIPLYTLSDILNLYKVQSNGTVLKIDCEGCEYECLLSTPDHILQRFSHMIIEYHYGYKNLKEKLEQCNFNVSITRPKIPRDNSLMRLGYIFAELKR